MFPVGGGLGPPQGESSRPQHPSYVVCFFFPAVFLAQWVIYLFSCGWPSCSGCYCRGQSTAIRTSEGSLRVPINSVIWRKADYLQSLMQAICPPCWAQTCRIICRLQSELAAQLMQHLGKETNSFFLFPSPPSLCSPPLPPLPCFAPSCHSHPPENKFACLPSLCLFPAAQEIDLFYWISSRLRRLPHHCWDRLLGFPLSIFKLSLISRFN